VESCTAPRRHLGTGVPLEPDGFVLARTAVPVVRPHKHRPPHPPAHHPAHPPAAPVEPARRSHAAAPVAATILLVGLLLGAYSILIPALLGLMLLLTFGSFLSTRLNPFSIGFYLTTKPSWSAMGVVFLSAFLLLLAAYLYFVHGLAPVIPGVRAP
ncbi:MAG: hypothetical protein L3K19_09375, partial [Thermoplasmata archaeon]|nr:hypothetical protein [Thermoplasmata archaeon]